VRFANGVIGSIGLENGMDIPTARVPKISDFYVDFSASKDGLRRSAWAMRRDGREYAERGDRIIAKSMDDRIGCTVALEAMRRLAGENTGHELYFVFTTQEEVGVRGARPAAFGINPDFAIALDVTSTGDQPKGPQLAVKLGHGASIKVADSGHIVPPAMKNLMIKRAEEAGIPYQLEILTLGSTDASGIQITGMGIPSGAISIPTRYIHTTSETVDVHDVQACVDLLAEMLGKPFEGLE
jgi:endoglucanase